MRKIFSDHPIFTLLFTSCLGCYGTLVLSIALILFSTTKLIEVASKVSPNTNASASYYTGNKNSKNKLMVVPIKGIILTSEFENPIFSLFDEYVFGYSIKKQIMEAANQPDIKGIILDIDSPGGTITGSQAISDGIKYYKDTTKKPVIAYNEGLAASGGYWVAASADKIFVDQGTGTGSIGVILGPFYYYNKVLAEGDISTENGIDMFYITAGTDKDLGNPYNKISADSRKKLQESVDSEYDNFVSFISKTRNIKESELRNNIGASVFSSDKAVELRLADEVKNWNESLSYLLTLTGLTSDDYQLISPPKQDFWSKLVSSKLLNKSEPKASCVLCGKMLYLYDVDNTRN